MMGSLDFVKEYERNGFAILKDFLSESEVNDLLRECTELVENVDMDRKVVFGTGQRQPVDDYFITSGDKIRYFYEADAFDQNGKLVVEKGKSLNKIGHALHWLNPVFKRVTFSDKVKDVARKLGYSRPVVAQSMFIFKNPGIGGEVSPHQDATFLYTTPRIKLFGLWFALEDVTLENGCLWFIPGSHLDGEVSRRFIRNPDKNATAPPLKFTSSEPEYNNQDYVPALVSKGSAVLIDGLVVHKSEHNASAKPRPVYTFHVTESDGLEWDKSNWLQPTESLPFPCLYDN